MDPRVKPEDDEGQEIAMTPNPGVYAATSDIVILGLDPRIHA